jgi:hypothetical protein
VLALIGVIVAGVQIAKVNTLNNGGTSTSNCMSQGGTDPSCQPENVTYLSLAGGSEPGQVGLGGNQQDRLVNMTPSDRSLFDVTRRGRVHVAR